MRSTSFNLSRSVVLPLKHVITEDLGYCSNEAGNVAIDWCQMNLLDYIISASAKSHYIIITNHSLFIKLHDYYFL